jgi:hypothetical protein
MQDRISDLVGGVKRCEIDTQLDPTRVAILRVVAESKGAAFFVEAEDPVSQTMQVHHLPCQAGGREGGRVGVEGSRSHGLVLRGVGW